MINYGYCCINTELRKQGIFTSRNIRKATLESKGLNYVSELAIQNLNDLQKILEWNINHNIYNFRISSELFPWGFTYNIIDLPNSSYILYLLKTIGIFVKENNIRVTFHPSHYTVLGSDNPLTVDKSIKELNHHSEIFDLIELSATPYNCINIHLSNTKPSKFEAASRFCENFKKLNINTQKRLTIENDDSPNQYSVKDLYELIHKQTKIPIVFDQYHFLLGPQDQTMEEAMNLAMSTWFSHKPLIHISSCKQLEYSSARITAHSDFIYEKPNLFNYDVDVDIECKSKEQGVLRFFNEQQTLPYISNMGLMKRIIEMNKRDRNYYETLLGLKKSRNQTINIKKGDYVKTSNVEGLIIKYSSNDNIIVASLNGEKYRINKNEIINDL